MKGRGVFCAALACAVACGSPSHELTGQVEIFSWWAGHEAPPLDALLNEFRREHPNVTVINSAVLGGAGTNAKVKLRERMVSNQPPDLFQVHGGAELIDTWVRVNGIDDSQSKMASLDGLFDAEGYRSVMNPGVLEIVSFRGHIYSLPLGVHKGNVLFFNPRVLSENGIQPPRTLDELWAACDRLAGKVPAVSLGYKEPWTLSDLFQNLLIAHAGAIYYRDFFAGRKSADDPVIASTLADMKRFVACANSDAATLDWTAASKMVRDGTAAMNIMGDWARGYYESISTWKDYGVAPSPGTEGVFVVVVDTFGLPRGAPDYENAVALLRVMASREGQTLFNRLKGSIPARTDVDPASFDAVSQATLRELASATQVPTLDCAVAADFMDAFRAALATFMVDGDADAVVHFLRNRYSSLGR
jgi:glucose/mannose transport system substrate-binding protein